MKLSRHDIAAFVLLCVFSLFSFAAISTKSGTFDEVQHFGMGRYLLLHQKWDVMGSILHPPLGYYLTSLPLLFYPEDSKLWEYEEKDRDIRFLGAVDVVRGQGMLSAPENSGDRLLILSRTMVLLLAMLLGIYVYRFSVELFGARGGLLSLLMYVCCPNILAFSGISTQDMPLTVFAFIAVYYAWRYLQASGRSNSLLTGLFLGLALATKFTAMLLLPFLLLLYAAQLIVERRKPDYRVLVIIAVAALIFVGSYGFNLTPFIQGYEYRLLEAKRGQGAFLNGHYSNFGWWYFYLVTLLIKTPIPFLALYLGATLVYFRKLKRSSLLTAITLYLPVICLLVLFSCSSFAIGIRYLLPMFPFMFVVVGALGQLESRRSMMIISCLVFWQVVGAARICPDYLAYFNEFVGGAGNGYKYLVDSNLDWGQDLKGLKKYMDKNGIKKVTLSYFGTDSPQRYGIDYDWLPSHHLYNPHPDRPYDIPPNQLIAISATNLQGVYLNPINEFAWLREQKPLAKIGYSIFIYDPQEIIRNSRTRQ